MACKDCGSECDCDRKESERDESEFHGAFSDDDPCPESEPLSEPTPSANARNRQIVKDLREAWDAIKSPRPIHVFDKATSEHIIATMHSVFDEYAPGTRLSLGGLCAMVNIRANIAPDEIAVVQDMVRVYGSQAPFSILKGKNGGVGRLGWSCPETRAVPIPKPTSTVVNDYTCGCGNTKCSKTEKSCWKCGAPIQVQA